MSSPLVSCLVTAYNYERFLERAVESALAQDVASLEVVIVNDGSTDGTAAVADALAAKHPDRVRVIHKENGGWISAINAAIEAARGTYLGILDADDTWLPGKLRAQVDLLEARPELGLVYSDLRLIDEDDATLEESFWAARNVQPFEGAAAAGLVTVGNCVGTSTILVRAALKDAFFPLPADVPYGDWWIGFRTAAAAEIAPIREPLTGYRQHGKNLTLDVEGEALVRELRKEHLFRRIALADLAPGVLTVAESVRAYGALEASAHVVRSAAGSAFVQLPDPKPAESEAALALAEASAPLAALRHCLRAVALDPWNEAARDRFVATAQELAETPHAREEQAAESDDFLALGFLDELVERPDMLSDYVHAFDGNANARLVLLAPGEDPEALGTALEPIAQALGLDREDSAEVVIVTAEGAGEELAQQAAAVYTREYRNSYLTDVPQVGLVEELIKMAQQPQPVAVAAAGTEPDVLAIGFLEEIAAAPELLEDFARTYDGRRDTRLVLLAPEFAGAEDQLSQALEQFAAAMGLDREESADVVVLTDPGALDELAPMAQAVYSRIPRSGQLAGLPHVGRAWELESLPAPQPVQPALPKALLEASPPWAAEVLPAETVPGMVSEEEKRYYRWLGRSYTGAGAVVELGPWLGCSTHHIVAGLEHAPAFEKLHVYDDFVWRSDWMDGYYDLADRPENFGDFKPIFDRYAAPIAGRIVADKVKFVDYDGNQALPQLTWAGGPVELIYVDCGRTIEANEAWWKIFSAHFVPGKTLVVMQDWQLWKDEPKQWYNQTKEFTDSKGDALELIHELRDGAVGTFLYHGEPAPEVDEAAPWKAEQLPAETVPGMITDEEKRYFRWVGRGYTGAGAVVELGPWLGCSTHHIVAGLEHAPAFEKLHVYDDFVWRSAWMDGYYDLADRPANHGDFKFVFDRYAAPIAHRVVAEKRKFIDYDGNEAVPQLTWAGGPIEIVYVDCGRTIEANEAWWRIFAPHFIPGKALVIMQDWQLWKEQPPQWYNQTKEFTDSKGAALELVHELEDGCIGTFLYHGEPQASGDEPAWHRTSTPEGIDRDRRDNDATAALIAKTLRPDSCTLDIGAHWGTVVDEFVKAAPYGRHVAYEPLPHLAEEIRRRYPAIDVRCAAASDSAGTATFVHVTELEGYSGFKAHPNATGEAQRELTVTTVRLDDDLPAGFTPDFVKIDVEGAELQVLEGMRATLRRARPTVVFEHGGAARQYGTESTQVYDLLRACGLEIHDLDGNGPYTRDQFEAAAAEGRYWNWAALPAQAGTAVPVVEDEKPSYLLVTYDSCRLDVLQEAHTPVLDSYAPIVAAQTPANFTYAAHQAFFVGMFPNAVEPLPFYNRFVNQLIGLGKVGEIQVVDKACAHRVASDVNLVSGLRDAGYQTVGTGAMNWFKQKALTQWFEKFAYTGTDAQAQIDFVKREVDASRPFFAFVNFGETHDPFDFEGKEDSCPIEVQSRLIQWPPAQNGVPVGRDSVAWEHQKRSAEFLDAKLPQLFEGLPGNTVVILCGDHGEAFGEDGYWGHGVNHPVVQTVPLAIFRLDRKPL